MGCTYKVISYGAGAGIWTRVRRVQSNRSTIWAIIHWPWQLPYIFIVPSGIQSRDLSFSHWVNYEAAALTTQPPRLDTYCKRLNFGKEDKRKKEKSYFRINAKKTYICKSFNNNNKFWQRIVKVWRTEPQDWKRLAQKNCFFLDFYSLPYWQGPYKHLCLLLTLNEVNVHMNM